MTGTWEAQATNIVATTLNFLFSVLQANAGLIMVMSAIGALIALGYLVKIVLEQIFYVLRHLWRNLKQEVTELYHIVRKHEWIRKTRGIIMAKWERSLIADILHDALFEANIRGTITNRQYSKFTKLVGKELNLPDMLPRKLHRAALRAHFKGTDTSPPTYVKLSGPVKPLPGPPPGDQVGPTVVVSHSNFLTRMKEKAKAA